MSFNISGIAINKNLEHQLPDLFQMLALDLEFDSHIEFDEASKNWKEEGVVDIYFTENGTLVFLESDLCIGVDYGLPEAHVFTFALSESAMFFDLNYVVDNKLVRSKMESKGEVDDVAGEPLDMETDNEDMSEVIWKQIEVVLGKSFFAIQPEEKAVRYRIKKTYEVDPEVAVDLATPKAVVAHPESYSFQPSDPNRNPKNNIKRAIIIFIIAAVLYLIWAMY